MASRTVRGAHHTASLGAMAQRSGWDPRVTDAQIVRGDSFFSDMASYEQQVLEFVSEMRRVSGERRDALKWVAAFSVGGLVAVVQLVGGPSITSRTDGVGLWISAGLFFTSILAAIAITALRDLALSQWLSDFRIKLSDVAISRQRTRRLANDLAVKVEDGLSGDDRRAAGSQLEAAVDAHQALVTATLGELAKAPFGGADRWLAVLCVGGFLGGVCALLVDRVIRLP